MASTQSEILKRLKTGSTLIHKGVPEEEVTVINKLEAFGIIKKEGRYTYKPTAFFHKYADQLIETETPLEEFEFSDGNNAQQIFNNTIHAQNIGQINQGSGNFSFEQINIEIIKESLQNQISEEQLAELMKAMKDEGRDGAVQKLVSFGGDVLANVIANILTNPVLYG